MEVKFFREPDSRRGTTYHIVAPSGVFVGAIQKFQTKWIGWDEESGAFRGPFGFGGSPFNSLNAAKAFARDFYGKEVTSHVGQL